MVFSAKVEAVFLTKSSREFPSADDCTNSCSSNAYLSWLVGSSIIQFMHEMSLQVFKSSRNPLFRMGKVCRKSLRFFPKRQSVFSLLKNRFHTFECIQSNQVKYTEKANIVIDCTIALLVTAPGGGGGT